MTANIEVICGTYEEFLLGYKPNAENENALTQSFATHSHTASIRCLATSGKYLVSGGADDRLFIYDMRRRSEIQIIQNHSGSIQCVQITPDESHIITGSADGSIRLFRIGSWILEAEWKRAHHGKAVEHISIHPSGKLALSVGTDETLKTWNLIKGRIAGTTDLKKKSNVRSVSTVTWNPSGNLFILLGMNGVEVQSIADASKKKFFKFESRPHCVSWCDDSKFIVGREDGSVAIYDVEKGLITEQKLSEQRVKALVYSDNYLSTCSSSGELSIWHVDWEDNEFTKTRSTNIGCRPTCLVNIPLFTMSPNKSDANVEETSAAAVEESSDDSNEVEAPVKPKLVKPVGVVTVSAEGQTKLKKKNNKKWKKKQIGKLNKK